MKTQPPFSFVKGNGDMDSQYGFFGLEFVSVSGYISPAQGTEEHIRRIVPSMNLETLTMLCRKKTL